MKLKDVEGSTTFNASTDYFQTVENHINKQLKQEESSTVEKNTIAEIAIAVGIKTNARRYEKNSSTTAVKLGSMKNDALKAIIERMNPEKDIDGLKDEMEAYLEGGMEELHSNIEEHSTLRYTDYIE